jgi:hypothetical protein
MPRIPVFKLRRGGAPTPPPDLAGYVPVLPLDGIQPGIDNLRSDVFLSPKFCEQMRAHLARLIVRHGGVERVLDEHNATPAEEKQTREMFVRPVTSPGAAGLSAFNLSAPNSFAGVTGTKAARPEPAEIKRLLTDIHMSSLQNAKDKGNIAVDLLGRIALVKFLRGEVVAQFAEIVERCRIRQKACEGVREQRAQEIRERVAAFQVGKKNVLRKTMHEVLHCLREIEKETLARTRRSMFGDTESPGYELLLNPLLFTEDGRDDTTNAEQYVLWGNFNQDADRFLALREVAVSFLCSLSATLTTAGEAAVGAWFNVPENAQLLVGSGTPGETPEARAESSRLQSWVALLEKEKLLPFVLAAYETVPLLAEYGTRVNPQQLKNALISAAELERVEKLIQDQGRSATVNLHAAVDRIAGCSGNERARIGARFLFDLMRYHRDLKRLEALNAAADSVNVIQNERMRELSSVNGLLHEFLLREEISKSAESLSRHVILKADVRDSTELTRSLIQLGLNPASYFSLNFYDPVNQLLARYKANKVFLEGDAIILSLVETEGDAGFLVSRACALARDMIEIVRGYNQRLQQSGLPTIELGIGICYQDTAPLFLLDGDRPIMISDALNESDRLSSCSKIGRRALQGRGAGFNVYAFQTVDDGPTGEACTELLSQFNIDGIRLSEVAFHKLQQEMSLELCTLELPRLWDGEHARLFRGLVPVDREVFRTILIREGHVALADPRDYTVHGWTEQRYYEVCTNAALYACLAAGKTASAKS